MRNKRTQAILSTFILFALIASTRVLAGNSSSPSERPLEDDLEGTYQNILLASDPVTTISNQLKQQIAIFYHASKHLQEFDRELDQATNPLELEKSPSFRKLQAIRLVSEQSKERLVFVYRRLLETRVEPGNSRSRKTLLRKMLNQYNRSLKTNDPVEALALHELRTELIETAAEIAKKLKIQKKPVAIPTISPYFKSEHDYFKAVKENQEELEKRSRDEKETGIDPTLEKQLLDEEENVHQLLWPALAQQTLKYEPSVGPGGNINGNTFPAHTWALTYDDGPSGKYTPTVLKNLQNNGKKASFFWLAQNIKIYQSIVKQVQGAGMSVNNHSYTHANLPKLGAAGLHKEIVTSTEVDTAIYGSKPQFFRLPYGAGVSIARIRKMIADQGMIHVFWNVDSLDWQDKNPDSVLARVKKQMSQQKHGVILFHDIHPQSVEASRMVLEWSATLDGTPEEIQWVTLPEITKKRNEEAP